jgi:hypothetical protein
MIFDVNFKNLYDIILPLEINNIAQYLYLKNNINLSIRKLII